jgi:hypothetical protein
MKTSDDKQSKRKFDLEKMKVAKLKNLHLINGGNVLADDPKTVTDLGKVGNDSGGRTL